MIERSELESLGKFSKVRMNEMSCESEMTCESDR